MTPLVSIVITNYNYAQYLPEAIESALAQDYPNTEIIVVDDGSKDDSVAIACRYPVTVVTRPNGGLSAARNSGMFLANGDYLLFLDADDRLTPTAISDLASKLNQAASDIAYAYGQMKYFGLREDLFASGEFDPVRLTRNNFICATTLFRRAALLRCGGYDTGFNSLREDWELYVRLYSQDLRGAFVPKIILECRKHKEHVRRPLAVKALSMAKLIYLYPALFLRHAFKHPFRYAYYFIKAKGWQDVRQYADKERDLRGVKQLSAAPRIASLSPVNHETE